MDSYFRLSENKTVNVFPIDFIVQLSKLTSQWANKYLTSSKVYLLIKGIGTETDKKISICH